MYLEDDEREIKNRPRRSQRKEKTKERAEAKTHQPYRKKSSNGRENQRNQPTHHRQGMKYNIPDDAHSNQPIKGNPQNLHNHHHHEASRNRNRPGKRYEHDKRMTTTPKLPATRHEQTGRASEKREMSGTRSEPQPTEASTSRQTHGRSPRMRRHRHGHDDITEQASRENGLIIPPRLTTRQAGSKAGRGETQIAGNRNGGGSEKVISARAVLTSSPQTTEDNRGGRDDARQGMKAPPELIPTASGDGTEPHQSNDS